MDVDPCELRDRLSKRAPKLWKQVGDLTRAWTAPVDQRLATYRGGFPKTFNDPVWGSIELFPWETLLLDTPLLQRLRGVRQLGMAHYVYPGAGHNRLEHVRGAVEAAERMVVALERNATHRRRFGKDPDEHVPPPSELDRVSTRLAALLHDVGHGPFGHATEPFIRAQFEAEFEAAIDVLRGAFAGTTNVATAEAIAVLIVLSDAMRDVFNHERFEATGQKAELPAAIAARILGSRACLTATYLSGLISGPIDADKLDYMARDSHHSGLPLGLDIHRLISKLEVVTVTPDNTTVPELRKRAEAAPRKRFYEVGISLSGLGAYEQLVVARVILYDRIYYHHKVRAAEAMVQRLYSLALEEKKTKRRFDLPDMLPDLTDDEMVLTLGGALVKCGAKGVARPRCLALASDVRSRQLYHRAAAFAARFIDLDNLPACDQHDTRAILWGRTLKHVGDAARRSALETKIFEKAKLLSEKTEGMRGHGAGLQPEQILVDLPLNKVVVGGGDILTRTEDGRVGTPNLFFDPERWSQAYEHQKQSGFVFAPRERIPLVALASKIVLFEELRLVLSHEADRVAKTFGVVRPEWIDQALAAGLCTKECAEALNDPRPRLVPVLKSDIRVPDRWKGLDPNVCERLADELNRALPGGLATGLHKALVDAVEHMAVFADVLEEDGAFTKAKSLQERDLQDRLRSHLRSRNVDVTEGEKVGGGETDLVLPGPIVVENKVTEVAADPFEHGPHYTWQARRYSIAVCASVRFVVLAYRPASEAALLPLPGRIRVVTQRGSPESTHIRVVSRTGTASHPMPGRPNEQAERHTPRRLPAASETVP